MAVNILKNLYVRFVETHGMARHFQSLAIWDAFKRDARFRDAGRDLPRAVSDRLLRASQSDATTVLHSLGSEMSGLSEERAEIIRRDVGTNEVAHEKRVPWWKHLWECYANPFNLLLTALAAVSYYTEDMKATIVISTMVVLSTVLRFVQETRSNRASDALKAMVGNKATVMRRDLSDEAADEAAQYFAVSL